MIFPIIFVSLVGTVVAPASIGPELNQNQPRFPWGVNFKYNGMLHHNLARVWIVTKIPLPKPNNFTFLPLIFIQIVILIPLLKEYLMNLKLINGLDLGSEVYVRLHYQSSPF